jgi:DNA primase catalytic subunit
VLNERESKEYHLGTNLNDKQEFNREVKTNIISAIKDANILIDYDVTPDPRRIIRLPGTVHGKTLRLCKIITDSDLEWSQDLEIIGYTPDSPIG